MSALNYKQAGVDIKRADLLVERIKKLTRKTFAFQKGRRAKSIGHIGGYASLYRTSSGQIIAASTDGVGTKLKLAFALKRHDTVGIDLVAMSVNDLLCSGARPLFFLDYFATGKLNSRVAESVIEGIAQGCVQAEAALVGGETAEMPSMYAPGEYDLAGFAVGEVDASELLPRRAIPKGSVLLGLPSSGFHSNGYSLLRKIWEQAGRPKSIGEQLLTPTRIYVRALKPLLGHPGLLGLSHITGSGFLNVPRMSTSVSYRIEIPRERPGVFDWVESRSRLPLKELGITFNCGVGMVLAVASAHAAAIMRDLKKRREPVVFLGETVAHPKGGGCHIVLERGPAEARIRY